MNKSIYLFHGEEDFLIEDKINRLKSQIENPALNVELLDGESLSLEKLSAALQTSPMFGGEKLVIIRDFEYDAERQKELIPLLQAIPVGVKIVFQASNIDKRSKFYKLANDQGEVIEFKTFAPWEQPELIAWIRGRAKEITAAAAVRLAEISGNNLRLLANEIEKLLTYVGERREIKEADVLALASAGETSAFALLDALREKNLRAALELFSILLKNKEDPFQLLSLLVTQYRLMLQIKALPGNEKDPWKVAKLIGGSPYFVKKCLENIDRFTLAELKKDFEYLLETNLKMKTGESQTVIFELLLTRLCGV